MTYDVTIGGRTFQVALEPPAAGGSPLAAFRITVNGTPLPADLLRIGDTVSILTENRGYSFTVGLLDRDASIRRISVSAREGDWMAEVADPRRLPPRREVALEGPARVSAAIAGKVVRILVAAGEVVKAGQPLLVLEAMKMQNEVRSPKGGRVARIAVEAGTTVLSGAVLAEIE